MLRISDLKKHVQHHYEEAQATGAPEAICDDLGEALDALSRVHEALDSGAYN